jgi:predicted MFS family arabinose efflux permease
MRVQPVEKASRRGSSLAGILEGLRYVRTQPVVNNIVGNLMMATVFGFSLFTLMPKWAVEILNGNETTYGVLLTSRGIGAVIGALMLAAVGATSLRGKLWTISNFTFPLGIIAFSLSRFMPLSMVIMAIMGWGWISLANISNAMVQTLVPDEMRGRVMGIYSLAFFGFMPIGSMIAGQMAARISMPSVTLSNAIILACFAVFIWLRRPQMRLLT